MEDRASYTQRGPTRINSLYNETQKISRRTNSQLDLQNLPFDVISKDQTSRVSNYMEKSQVKKNPQDLLAYVTLRNETNNKVTIFQQTLKNKAILELERRLHQYAQQQEDKEVYDHQVLLRQTKKIEQLKKQVDQQKQLAITKYGLNFIQSEKNGNITLQDQVTKINILDIKPNLNIFLNNTEIKHSPRNLTIYSKKNLIPLSRVQENDEDNSSLPKSILQELKTFKKTTYNWQQYNRKHPGLRTHVKLASLQRN